MDIVVLVINYNDALTTIEFIHQLERFDNIRSLVILDNASTDNSYKELKQFESDDISIIQPPRNLGYGGGINYGINFIEKQFGNVIVVVSNSDILLPDLNVFKEIEKGFAAKDVSIVAPRILEAGSVNLGWKTNGIWYEGLCNLPLVSRWFRKRLYYKESEIEKDIQKIDIMSGCFFALRLEDIKLVNGFDENIFLYYEENVISVKLSRESKQIMLVNTAEVVHNHSVSIDKSYSRLKKFDELKKSQHYFFKEYKKSSYISLLWLRSSQRISRVCLRIRLVGKR